MPVCRMGGARLRAGDATYPVDDSMMGFSFLRMKTFVLWLGLALCLAAAAWMLPRNFGSLAALRGWWAGGAAAQPAQPLLPQHLAHLPADHPRAPLWQGLAALNAQDASGALAVSDRLAASAAWGEEEILALYRGKAFALSGQPQRAAETWQARGLILELMRAAADAYRQRDYPAAQVYYQAAFALDAERAAAGLADTLYYGLKDASAARKVLENALQRYPLSASRGGWLARLADYLTADKRYAEALSLYLQAVEADPQSAWLRVSLGRGYQRIGERTLSAAAAQAALSLNPRTAGAFDLLGDLAVETKQWAEAAAAFSQARSLNPAGAWYVIKEASARLNLGQCQPGADLFNEAQRSFPATVSARQWGLYHLQAAACFQRAGDRQGMAALAARAVQSAPGDAEIAKQAEKYK